MSFPFTFVDVPVTGAGGPGDQSGGEVAQAGPQHAPLRRTVLTQELPRAQRLLDMRSAAGCLESRDPFVCQRAVQCLERLLIEHRAVRRGDRDNDNR